MKASLAATLAVAGCLALAGCNAVPVTSAICQDAAAVQTSSLKLNANETLALNGIVTDCALTAGGTNFSQSNVASAIIADAIALQQSGLFSDVRITALAPEQQVTLKRIKGRWERLAGQFSAN